MPSHFILRGAERFQNSNSMIVSIAQPAYLPWLGYFDRIARSDIHIVLDSVQIERRGFTHRNKIRTKDNWLWLTVPIKKKGNYHTPIYALKINNESNWKKKHWNSIVHRYAKSPHFKQYKEPLEYIYMRDWLLLNALLQESTNMLFEMLGLKTQLIFTSKMDIKGEKSELILNLCKEVDAKKYISGPFGKDYLDQRSFENAGIEIQYHNYKHPEYVQFYSGFEPYMSIIDLIFNHGPNSLGILTAN